MKFVEMGNLNTPNRSIYLSSSEIPHPGYSTHESGVSSAAFMVSHQDTKNHMNAFCGNKGERRWTLDNCDNEETVILRLGGLWSDEIVIEGLMDTLHTENSVAQGLMKWFQSALRREGFNKIDGRWVGSEALAMLNAGKRLTQAEQSPRQFDLKAPAKTPDE